jgi:hypothetical protein
MQVGERELHRLDLQVQRGGAVEPAAAQVEVLQHAERHLRGDALAVGWHLVQHVLAVALRERLDPTRLVVREIVFGHRATVSARMVDHALRQRAAVERCATAVGDLD